MKSYCNVCYLTITTKPHKVPDKSKRAEKWLDSIYKNPTNVKRQDPLEEKKKSKQIGINQI